MKVLVVDDSRAMRMIVRRMLSSADVTRNATVFEASNGQEALGIISDRLPHVVLCDWHMPVMSGMELLEVLQSHGSDIPFGFVTAEANHQLRAKALAGGAKFFVTKPFTAEMLGRAIAGAVER